jgi:hypothetical protein
VRKLVRRLINERKFLRIGLAGPIQRRMADVKWVGEPAKEAGVSEARRDGPARQARLHQRGRRAGNERVPPENPIRDDARVGVL